MHSEGSAYGLWTLVLINVAIFVGFAFRFWHPKRSGTGERLAPRE
jgi:hypothetical protein